MIKSTYKTGVSGASGSEKGSQDGECALWAELVGKKKGIKSSYKTPKPQDTSSEQSHDKPEEEKIAYKNPEQKEHSYKNPEQKKHSYNPISFLKSLISHKEPEPKYGTQL